MRVSRFLPVLVAGAVFTATAAPASAATPGVGTTVGSLEVLSLDVGELLELDLLTDFAAANTDPDVDDAGAAAALKALVVDALVLPEPVELGVLDVSSDGEEKTATNEESAIPDTLAAVLAGDLLPASLVASLTEPGAMSTTAAGITELDILGGIAGVNSSQLGITAASLTEQADGARALLIDKITVLELGDLLPGLGIPVELLPLDTVLDLIGELGLTDQLETVLGDLGLPVDTLDTLDAESIVGLIETIGSLEDLLSTDESALCDDGNELLSGVAGGLLGAADPALLLDTCEDVLAVIDDLPVLDDLLGETLDSIIGLLLDTALVELNALDVKVITAANDSLDTSNADVIATLGGLSIAGLPVPEVDLTAVTEQANAALDTLLTEINGVLGGLVSVDLAVLQDEHSVEEDGDAIVSSAEFTGLALDLTSNLTQPILDQVTAGLPALGGDLPLGELPIGDLLGDDVLAPITGLLGQTDALSALSDGMSLRVASLGQTSTFTEVLNNTATPTPAAPELPQTGSNDALMLALAAIAAGGALGIRRVVRIEE